MLIRLVENDSNDLDAVRGLFKEYAESLGFSLCFQNFAAEMAGLPGPYAPPAGRLYLGLAETKPAGCVGLRRLDDQTCEMKRLYVRPAFRGSGLGRRLAERVIADARMIGYRAIRLDTLPERMHEADTLYRALGFQPIAPYYENPVPGAAFLELRF